VTEAIQFVDQSIRDGQQSLWGLRMRAGHMLPIAKEIDEAGFHVVDFTGSAMFEVMTRQFKENPWELLDLVREAMPNSDLRSGARPNAAMGTGFAMAPFSVVDLLCQTMVKHGVTSFWLYDCLYNMDQMERLARAISSVGGKVLPGLMYALSEYHTDEFFADKVRTIASWGVADAIYLEDASGVLTPDRAATLIPALIEASNGIPIEMHCHNTTGLASLNYLEGIKAGIRTIHTASRPLANGPSLPSTEVMLDNIKALGYTSTVDESRLERIAAYFERLAKQEGYELGVPAEYSVRPYEHQLPGGMLGTLKYQLATHGLSHRLQETLEETAIVRRELGYPVMATPISQLVGIQALLNITSGERYKQVPDDVIKYVLGWTGRPPGPIDPEVLDRILGSERGKELAKQQPPQPTIEELRKQHRPGISDEELLLRAVMQESTVDAMYASGPAVRDLTRQEHPVAALIRSLSAPGCSDHVHFEDADLSVELHR